MKTGRKNPYVLITIYSVAVWVGLVALTNMKPFYGILFHDNGDQLDVNIEFGEIRISRFLLNYPDAHWTPGNVTFQSFRGEAPPSSAELFKEWRYHLGLDFLPSFPSEKNPKQLAFPLWFIVASFWAMLTMVIYLSNQRRDGDNV